MPRGGRRAEHRHALKLDLQIEAAVVQGDLVRLTQALANLLDNASKFSPDGRLVVLCVNLSGNRLQIRVTDQGVGISEELTAHAFDMFVQFEPGLARTGGGLGIGLTVAREIANRWANCEAPSNPSHCKWRRLRVTVRRKKKENGLQAGFDEYLVKPIKFADL